MVYSNLTLPCVKGGSCDDARAVFPLKERLGLRRGATKRCVARRFASQTASTGKAWMRQVGSCALSQPYGLIPRHPHRPMVLGVFWGLGRYTAALLYALISETGRKCRSKAGCITAHACETDSAWLKMDPWGREAAFERTHGRPGELGALIRA
ncbi:hypothetical protein BDW02DRAFT_565089 [Decorospora gaudefroyi]|uniref:Uncharacterized protein n=1 Tax=Decorospora gaudefroyi TaxID=184978 RepID=A0A6A5KX75_9PLEO|nr:hypothetical protein BDW02DRAFT_565089 [Decorospora gaudefroyi]